MTVQPYPEARRIAHEFTPRCTGGAGHGIGGDGPRYHSKRCDELACAIHNAMLAEAQPLRFALEDIACHASGPLGGVVNVTKLSGALTDIAKRGLQAAGIQKANADG